MSPRAKPHRPSPPERARAVLRNQAEIYELRATGSSWREVERRTGIKERTAREYLRTLPSQDDYAISGDALDIAHEHIHLARLIHKRAQEAYERADNSSAAVGALRVQLNAQQLELDARRLAGHLPHQMAWVSKDTHLQ